MDDDQVVNNQDQEEKNNIKQVEKPQPLYEYDDNVHANNPCWYDDCQKTKTFKMVNINIWYPFLSGFRYVCADHLKKHNKIQENKIITLRWLFGIQIVVACFGIILVIALVGK